MTTQILIESLVAIFTLQNMVLMVIAIVLGIMAGALPGFTATMAVALMVPLPSRCRPYPV